MSSENDRSPSNRERKVQGREKRRKYVQGTPAYTRAVLNSIARRAAEKDDKPDKKG